MLAILASTLPYLRFLSNKYVLMALLVVGVWFTYNRMSNKIDDLETQKAIKDKTIAEQVETIKSQKKDFKEIIAKQKDLTKTVQKLKKDKTDLEEVLHRERKGKKTLEELARKKTALVEKKVNDATQRVFDCFESVSNGKDC